MAGKKVAIELRACPSVGAFRSLVWPFLTRDEAQYCLGLSVIVALESRPAPRAHLWAVLAGARIVGAAWFVAPGPLGLTRMPNAAVDLVAGAAARLASPPRGVIGPCHQAHRFKAQWERRAAVRLKSSMRQRIFELTAVKMPRGVPGRMRLAGARDFEILEEWSRNFARDCGLDEDVDRAKEYAANAIKNQTRYLWIVDGRPVAMAGVNGPTPTGIRVSWVYVPDAARGRGYASALVATLSQVQLASGRQRCFLYADRANPVSNRIYQRIGYRPLHDVALHEFI